MKSQFNYKNLENLGIFELRNIAREIGVHSPTVYRKPDLIKEVLAIAKGEKEPYKAKTKQGRPPKSIGGINHILDIFVPKDEKSYAKEQDYQTRNDFYNLSQIVAKQSDSKLMEYNAQEDKKILALLELQPEGYGFAYKQGYKTSQSEDTFFVSNTYVNKYRLQTGDWISGFAKKISEDKPYVINHIEKINDIKVKENISFRKNFNDFMAVHPNTKIIFDNHNKNINKTFINSIVPIGKGQRAIFIVPQGSDYSTLITGYFNDITKAQNFYKKFIFVHERPEDVSEYTTLLKDANILFTSLEESVSQSIQKIELAVENLKRKVEEGSDVLLVISNLNRLQDFYKKQEAYNKRFDSEPYLTKSIMPVEKLLMNARNLEGLGSLTILAIVEDNPLTPEFITTLKDVCNSEFYIREEAFLKDSLWFDILTTNTRKSNLLLTKEEQVFVREFYKDLNSNNQKGKTQTLEDFLKRKM